MSHHHYPLRLIITADDYGASPRINAAIEACLAAGALRATCVMANMPGYGEASRLRQQFPDASIGLHWNLTAGRPVAPPDQVASLIDGQGRFWPAAAFRRRWLLGRIAPEHVLRELRAQYDRLALVAGQPDFWNTHQNIHLLPQLFSLTVAVARQLAIPAMRSHQRLWLPLQGASLRDRLIQPLAWLKGQVIAGWAAAAVRQGMRMPAGLIGLPESEAGLITLAQMVAQMPRARVAPVELVVHPALQGAVERSGVLAEVQAREYALLRDPSLVDRLAAVGVQTVGFEALA